VRIIGGTHRGRRLAAPEGLATRPMTDRVRENLFNLLGQRLDGAVVLDLFCGSGALGIEALSRGAASVTFVDTDPDAAGAVETNCRALGLAERARVLCRDALRPGPWLRPIGGRPRPARGRPGDEDGGTDDEGGRPAGAAATPAWTHVFVDPPYRLTADPEGQARLAALGADLARLGCLAPGAVVMLRVQRGTAIALPWPGFDRDDERSYGTTTLHLMTYRGR